MILNRSHGLYTCIPASPVFGIVDVVSGANESRPIDEFSTCRRTRQENGRLTEANVRSSKTGPRNPRLHPVPDPPLNIHD